MNPRRLLIQGNHNIKVNLKIKAKVSKKLRPLIFQKKKVILGIVFIVIKMVIRPYKKNNKEKTNAMVHKYKDVEGSLDVDEKLNYSTIQKVEEYQDIEYSISKSKLKKQEWIAFFIQVLMQI